jgi:hypothetical protein
MSDQQTAEGTETETAATEQQTETETKPTETVDFWKAKAREQEKRAKENATAAKRLAEIEQAQKSEAEKAADRIKSLEDEVNASKRDALRFKVASKYGIGDEDTDLFLTASDEETLNKQAERLVGRQDERKKQGNRVPAEGTNPTAKPDEMREFARNLFGSAD